MGSAAIAGGGLSLAGGLIGGRAAKRAAQQQAAAAQQLLQFTKETQQRAFEEAAADPNELRAFEQSLAQQERNVAAEASLLQSIDPTLIEASQQALKLLRGESAGVTQAAQRTRQRQRSRLVDTLREQLGPGAETSSAGLQALRQFDLETQDVVAQQQQGALGQLFQAQASILPALAQTRGQQVRGLVGVGQAFGGIRQRRVNALLQPLGAITQAGQGVTQTAGAGQTGRALLGQTIGNIGAGLLQGGLAQKAGTGSRAQGFADVFGTDVDPRTLT